MGLHQQNRQRVDWRWVVVGLAIPGLGFVGRAQAGDLPGAVEVAEESLRQAWVADPLTSGRPWPQVVLLDATQQPLKECPGAPGAITDSLGVYCPESGKVLLGGKWLAREVKDYGTWGAAYWIAAALGQVIRSQPPYSDQPLNGAAGNLQATCLAGVLMARAPRLQPGKPEERLLPAFTAFRAKDAARQGTASQRAYALLTGLGATSTDCSAPAMTGLSSGQVSDSDLLNALVNYGKDRSVGAADMEAVDRALCRPKPGRPCPPSLRDYGRGPASP